MKRFSHQFLKTVAAVVFVASASMSAHADVKLPSIFGDHMVLQREIPCKIWGWADAGEKVTVKIGEQSHSATADKDGYWRLNLKPLKAGGPHQLTIKGNNEVTFEDVLVGEVWVCSGQSNMAWPVSSANDSDLEALTAKYPNIRLISVPQVGTQEPQSDFHGAWTHCTPETVKGFSAVGYFFGRQLHQTLDVPIGLIDNAWGGSAAEAWIPNEVLAADGKYNDLLENWATTAKNFDWDAVQATYQEKLKKWQDASKTAKEAGKPLPNRPRAPRNPLTGNHRPANIYNGVLKPTIGYGIRGAIWYQGESNAGRAYQYRDLFPLMITQWRQEWGIGDFPFYWVQLADYRDESPEPQESAWAELREAQTMTLSLPNSGEAVITDLGEAHDIHPRDKQNVAKRLARWALANDYGIEVPFRSPQYKSMEKNGSRIVLTFDHIGGGLDTFDVRQPVGFAIAGEDKQFQWATARLVGKNQIEVWSEDVPNPVSVRYGWADNPVTNVQNVHGLKLTPFRTDDWPGVTAEVTK
ncbi:MAG: sialate O-acetylesterase [Planctomycetaceae bacterium]|nr:sialate O-acetylesterase [Planctomycetaceae bacterium]MDG2390285.1 sialate O-acetylesterase [Planctomycetaceae bacterium]